MRSPNPHSFVWYLGFLFDLSTVWAHWYVFFNTPKRRRDGAKATQLKIGDWLRKDFFFDENSHLVPHAVFISEHLVVFVFV